jgi:hypothetical protein
MDYDFRNAIMRSAESFVVEYDPNENRRVDINTARNLVKKLKIIKKHKECSICFDTANSGKISKLPCCGNKICQPCIINTITCNTKDCPMCRKDLVATINSTPLQQSTDSDSEPETPQQYSTPIISKSKKSNQQRVKINYKLKKCNPTSYKDPDSNESIRTQKYTFISEESTNANGDKRKPLEIVYHNNSENNRRRFEIFLQDYKRKLEYNKINNELEVWKLLCSITKNFTDKHKYSPKFISDITFNNLYEKILTYLNSNLN